MMHDALHNVCVYMNEPTLYILELTWQEAYISLATTRKMVTVT